MKIAFLSFYSGKVNRGVETYVKELSVRLKTNNEVIVYQGENAKNILSFTLEVLRKINPETDIVIATNGGMQSVLCKLWCLWHGKKLIVPGQSGPGRDDRINLLCHPDVFVALTNFQAAWAIKFGHGVKVEVIPNGVDLNKFISVKKPKNKVILTAGALTKDKRQELIIKAVSEIKNASLLLVGQGLEQENLKKLGEKLLPNRFKILSLPFDKMPAIYSMADIFTFSTVPWESFGIVMVEAMASGLPVVATDDPIRREIVGDAGLFVNPENTVEYAQTLEKALYTNWENKPRIQAEKFSWDKIAKDYENLFKSLTI